MIILTIRTDKPEAEVGLYDNDKKCAYETWHGHRELSATLQRKIDQLLHDHNKSLDGLEGIVVFAGPGSFTGLRIGISVANTLAYSFSVPVIATGGEDWIADGVQSLQAGYSRTIALPEYGSPAHTTQQKK